MKTIKGVNTLNWQVLTISNIIVKSSFDLGETPLNVPITWKRKKISGEALPKWNGKKDETRKVKSLQCEAD